MSKKQNFVAHFSKVLNDTPYCENLDIWANGNSIGYYSKKEIVTPTVKAEDLKFQL